MNPRQKRGNPFYVRRVWPFCDSKNYSTTLCRAPHFLSGILYAYYTPISPFPILILQITCTKNHIKPDPIKTNFPSKNLSMIPHESRALEHKLHFMDSNSGHWNFEKRHIMGYKSEKRARSNAHHRTNCILVGSKRQTFRAIILMTLIWMCGLWYGVRCNDVLGYNLLKPHHSSMQPS